MKMSFCHLQGCRICSTTMAGQEEMSGGRHKAERVIILPFYLLIRKHAMQRSVKVILRNSGSNILFPELPDGAQVHIQFSSVLERDEVRIALPRSTPIIHFASFKPVQQGLHPSQICNVAFPFASKAEKSINRCKKMTE